VRGANLVVACSCRNSIVMRRPRYRGLSVVVTQLVFAGRQRSLPRADTLRGTVTSDGRPLNLSLKESEVLEALLHEEPSTVILIDLLSAGSNSPEVDIGDADAGRVPVAGRRG
jgi:hypothetical protein